MTQHFDEHDEEEQDDDDVDPNGIDPEGPDPSDMDYSDEPDLEVCPNCRKMIVEDAEQCPHCGEYISAEDAPMPRWGWVTIIIACLAILAFILARGF